MIRQLQQEHFRWQKKNFDNVVVEDMILGVVEELGELAHSILKEKQKVRMHEDHEEKAKDAVGDIFIFLTGVCNRKGWDLQTIIEDVWKEVSSRDWRQFPNDGRTF